MVRAERTSVWCLAAELGGGVVANRLTDEQKEKIVDYYAMCGNFAATARANAVSASSVRRIVRQACAPMDDAVGYCDMMREKAHLLADRCLDELARRNLVEEGTPSQLTAVLRTVVDQFGTEIWENGADHNGEAEDTLTRARRLLDGVDSAI